MRKRELKEPDPPGTKRGRGLLSILKGLGAEVELLVSNSTNYTKRYRVVMPDGREGLLVKTYMAGWQATIDGRTYPTGSVEPTLAVLKGNALKPEDLKPFHLGIYEKVMKLGGVPARPEELGSSETALKQLVSLGFLKKVGTNSYVCSSVKRVLEDPVSSAVRQRKIGCRHIQDLDSENILDLETGLEWLAGPDSDVDFQQAQGWISEIAHHWRSPTIEELKRHFDEPEMMTDYFGISGYDSKWIWTADMFENDESRFMCFSVHIWQPVENWVPCAFSKNMRAMAVRRSGES